MTTSLDWAQPQSRATVKLAALIFFLSTAANGGLCSAPQKQTSKDKLERALTVIRDAELQRTDPDRVIKAIEELGRLRDPAAVQDLVQLLTFRRWFPWEKDPNVGADFTAPPSQGARYPAVNALMGIGEASLPALFKVIESHEPNSLETQNAMEVIIYLSRDKRAKYVEELNEQAARAPTPEAAQRLLKAAQTLKQSKR